ncbi:MAG: structural protein MipA [Novosphingobium sp.]|nr:structural protein MipA [Novosphingobium sp.]
MLATPAAAQEVAPLEADGSAFKGDFLIVGAGVAVVPSYEGSDDLVVSPAGAVAGRIGGIGINARSFGLALDLIPDSQRVGGIGFTLGPVVRYRTNRSGRIADDVVAKLGKLKGVVEAGVNVGIDAKHVLNPYDSLSFSVDLRWDVSGHGSGLIISPGISYLTPLSKGIALGGAVTSNFIDSRYARYNFSISNAGSLASGLPQYTARGGLKDVGIGAFTAFDLDGNFLDGGPAIGLGAMYSRLFNSAAESPITSIRGSRSQLIFGAAASYTF